MCEDSQAGLTFSGSFGRVNGELLDEMDFRFIIERISRKFVVKLHGDFQRNWIF